MHSVHIACTEVLSISLTAIVNHLPAKQIEKCRYLWFTTEDGVCQSWCGSDLTSTPLNTFLDEFLCTPDLQWPTFLRLFWLNRQIFPTATLQNLKKVLPLSVEFIITAKMQRAAA